MNVYQKKITFLFISVLACAHAMLAFIGTARYGSGVTPDGVAYLSAAMNLKAGVGLVRYDDAAFVSWPPLYSFTIFITSLPGLNEVSSAGWINIVASGLSVLLASMIYGRHLQSKVLLTMAVLLTALSPLLLKHSMSILSEPLFLLILLLALFALPRYISQPCFKNLLPLLLIGWLITLQRYIGVIVVVCISLTLFFFLQENLRIRLQKAASYFLISLVPLALYVLRNYILSGTLTGSRGTSIFSFLENIRLTIDVFQSWLWGFQRLAGVGDLLLLLVISSAILYHLVSLKRRSDTHERTQIFYIVILFCVYMAFIMISASWIGYDRINDRILYPMWVPLFFLLFRAGDDLLHAVRKRGWQITILLGIIVYFSGLFIQYSYQTYHLVRHSYRFGAGGFTQPKWMDSELLESVKNHTFNGKVFSNFPDLLFIFGGVKCYMSPFTAETVGEFYDKMSEDGNYLVWFSGDSRDYIHNLESMESFLCLRQRTAVRDGAIFEIEKPKE